MTNYFTIYIHPTPPQKKDTNGTWNVIVVADRLITSPQVSECGLKNSKTF